MALIKRGKTFQLLLLLWLSGSAQALADYAPARSPVDISRDSRKAMETKMRAGSFDSAIDAVVAASDAFNPHSIAEDREYMGAILFGAGRYSYTVEAGEVGHDQITVRIKVPGGSQIVAFWHTHGAAGADRSYFSEVDTELARQWKVPFYLADYTGNLKVYEAGDKLLSSRKAKRLGLPARSGFSKGRRVEKKGGQLVRIATHLHIPGHLHKPGVDSACKGGELMAHNNFQFAYM